MLDCELILMVNDAGASMYGYKSSTLAESYSGPPDVSFSMPEDCGYGHGFSVAPGNDIYLTASEAPPHIGNNAYEQMWYIPAAWRTGKQLSSSVIKHYTGDMGWVHPFGARTMCMLWDGRLVVSTGGGQHGIITPQLLAGIPGWGNTKTYTCTGARGELQGWDCHVTQNGSKVWYAGYDSLYRVSYEGSPGIIQPDKIAKGSNIGAPNWGGTMAFTKTDDCLLVQSDRNAVARFSAAQLDALGEVHTNPEPAGLLTCSLWNFNLDYESLWMIVLDRTGGGYVGSLSWGPPYPPSKFYYFTKEQFEEGGNQTPVKILTAPVHNIGLARYLEGYGLWLR